MNKEIYQPFSLSTDKKKNLTPALQPRNRLTTEKEHQSCFPKVQWSVDDGESVPLLVWLGIFITVYIYNKPFWVHYPPHQQCASVTLWTRKNYFVSSFATQFWQKKSDSANIFFRVQLVREPSLCHVSSLFLLAWIMAQFSYKSIESRT